MPPDFLDIESLESLSISATHLNALTLKILGKVDIEWAYNTSRYMILQARRPALSPSTRATVRIRGNEHRRGNHGHTI